MCPAIFCQEGPSVAGPPSNPAAMLQEEPYYFSDSDLASYSLVEAAFWYGGGIYMTMLDQTTDEETIVLDPFMRGKETSVPLLMIYGAGGDPYLGEEQRAQTSYDLWEGERALLVLHGLDHNGMTDVPITLHENVIPSTLPAEVRAPLVADSVDIWLKTVLDDPSGDVDLDEFCDDIGENLGADSVELCLTEEHKDNNTSLSSATSTGVVLSTVAAAFTLLGI